MLEAQFGKEHIHNFVIVLQPAVQNHPLTPYRMLNPHPGREGLLDGWLIFLSPGDIGLPMTGFPSLWTGSGLNG